MNPATDGNLNETFLELSLNRKTTKPNADIPVTADDVPGAVFLYGFPEERNHKARQHQVGMVACLLVFETEEACIDFPYVALHQCIIAVSQLSNQTDGDIVFNSIEFSIVQS